VIPEFRATNCLDSGNAPEKLVREKLLKQAIHNPASNFDTLSGY